MSGSVSFPNDDYWSKAGWAFHAVLDFVCKDLELSGVDPLLLKELSDTAGDVRVIGYLVVNGWSEETKNNFYAAVENGYKIAVNEGVSNWNSEEGYKGFLSAFNELVEMCQSNSEKNS